MNDFTKEELETLNGAIICHGCEGDELHLKIKSLIDNYCEHEWENICCQCTLDKIYCHKCEKDMGDLNQRYENE